MSSPVRILSSHCGGAWSARPLRCSGFCETWRADGPSGALFVKTLPLARGSVLAAEADGLEALAATRTIDVPEVVGYWTDSEQDAAVLALQWLDFEPARVDGFGERLGRALAALHGASPVEGGGRFGWRCDNMIGGTPQGNAWSTEGGLAGWVQFFGSQRLSAMSGRLRKAGCPGPVIDAVEHVIAALPAFFADAYVPRARLVHGDLWHGNWGCVDGGRPVIFDPAVSMSDPETDLAMMELFGPPPEGFWPAYREAAGLAPGYEWRRDLYQLYHLLNHELLFGGYARQAMAIMARLLKRA